MKTRESRLTGRVHGVVSAPRSPPPTTAEPGNQPSNWNLCIPSGVILGARADLVLPSVYIAVAAES